MQWVEKQTRNPEAKISISEAFRGPIVLNPFSFTCAFSLAAILHSGKESTSQLSDSGRVDDIPIGTLNIDASPSSLEWAKENFRMNHVPVNNIQQTFWPKEVFRGLYSLMK